MSRASQLRPVFLDRRMELPRRTRGDELLAPGELLRLRERLRATAARHDLSTVIACAFDHRTRMLPFIYADTRMVPAGVRAIGSAMVDSGFHKTRIVLQQWNRHFRPSEMLLDGRVPDVFMVSTMGMHSDRAMELIFFFQAEDGIRGGRVTGVQTCALPI